MPENNDLKRKLPGGCATIATAHNLASCHAPAKPLQTPTIDFHRPQTSFEVPVAAQGQPAPQHGTAAAPAKPAAAAAGEPCDRLTATASSHLHATHQLSIPVLLIHQCRAPDQMAPARQLTPALGSMRCRSGSGSKLAAASHRHAAPAEAVAVPCWGVGWP